MIRTNKVSNILRSRKQYSSLVSLDLGSIGTCFLKGVGTSFPHFFTSLDAFELEYIVILPSPASRERLKRVKMPLSKSFALLKTFRQQISFQDYCTFVHELMDLSYVAYCRDDNIRIALVPCDASCTSLPTSSHCRFYFVSSFSFLYQGRSNNRLDRSIIMQPVPTSLVKRMLITALHDSIT